MKVDQQTLTNLSTAVVDGNVLRLTTGQLDRKQYEALNKVLVAMGGKWNRKEQGHTFEADPTTMLEHVLLTGEVTIPQDFGYFPTPQPLAAHIVELVNLSPTDTVLEPSAGQGAIADEIAKIVPRNQITTVELLPDNCKVLIDKGYDVCQGDFISQHFWPTYTRVVMNPPFERQQDIDHVLRAYSMLCDGGRLVSIMSAGVLYRQNKKSAEFRDLLAEKGGYEVNEEGAFKSSGTMVKTITVILDK